MADATSTMTPTVSDGSCGCCRPPEPKTTDEIISELETRRDALDARLAGVGAR